MNLLRKGARHARRTTTRMLAGYRFRASVRSTDVFLVAYPKSGTTWLGFLIASALADRMNNRQSWGTISDFRQFLPDINSPFPSTRTLDEFGSLAAPRVFSTHTLFSRTFKRVIYLVRDPRDVMVSYYYHHRRSVLSFEIDVDEFVRHNDMYPGDWGEHVRGWLQDPNDSRLVIRYEDLHARPEDTLERVFEFCGLEVSDEQLRAYIRKGSFDNMRRLEETKHPGNVRAIRFVRQGKVADWRNELNDRSVKLIESRYEPIMKELGYAATPHSCESRRDQG